MQNSIEERVLGYRFTGRSARVAAAILPLFAKAIGHYCFVSGNRNIVIAGGNELGVLLVVSVSIQWTVCSHRESSFTEW